MDNQKSSPQSHNFSFEGSEPELLHNPVVEEFFAGLKHDMRRPAPGQEAIAAALQAIQKVAANSDTEDALAAEARVPTDRAVCASCGGDNPATNRFCARCGVPLPQMAPRSESMKESAEERISSVPKSASGAEPTAPGQHYYHHHYHHHYFSPTNEALPIAGAEARAVQSNAVRDNRVRSTLGISSLSRAKRQSER